MNEREIKIVNELIDKIRENPLSFYMEGEFSRYSQINENFGIYIVDIKADYTDYRKRIGYTVTAKLLGHKPFTIRDLIEGANLINIAFSGNRRVIECESRFKKEFSLKKGNKKGWFFYFDIDFYLNTK